MTNVAKYNTLKGVSTSITFGTPIITLCACGDFITHRSETAISAAGIFVLLIVLFFAKDKLIEYFKAPSALILSSIMLVLILLIENIILPMKTVCIATMIVSGVDELTFKRWYTSVERILPSSAKNHKHIGFVFGTMKTLLEEANNAQQS